MTQNTSSHDTHTPASTHSAGAHYNDLEGKISWHDNNTCDVKNLAQSSSHESSPTKASSKFPVLIGLITLLLVAGLSSFIIITLYKSGVPHNKNWRAQQTSSRKLLNTTQENHGQFVNGPYQKILVSDIRLGEVAHAHYNTYLMVVGPQNPFDLNVEDKLVKVPFEQAQAQEAAAQAYKNINVALDQKFHQPINLRAAYVPLYKCSDTQYDNALGLGLDLQVPSYSLKNFDQSASFAWLSNHAAEYGLILRYPKDKEDVTHMPYTPYHFRYVGIPHAHIMSLHDWTLEEYLESLGIDKEFEFSTYVISRQKGPQLMVPKDFTRLDVSPDNLGSYVVTAQIDFKAHKD